MSDIYSGTGGGHWDILGHAKCPINASLMDKREKEREGERPILWAYLPQIPTSLLELLSEMPN